MAETTYDGRPISGDPPFGATVVVHRPGPMGSQFLVLHRAHNGESYEGDWAWTPPAGARQPGEDPRDCAARELEEETGLRLPLQPTDGGSSEWVLYVAQAPADAVVVVDDEHDRFEWLAAADAARRCRPDRVAEQIRFVSQLLGESDR